MNKRLISIPVAGNIRVLIQTFIGSLHDVKRSSEGSGRETLAVNKLIDMTRIDRKSTSLTAGQVYE